MAHIFDDNVLETAAAPGTAAFALSAVTGFRRFAQAQHHLAGTAIAVNDTVFYSARAVDASDTPTGDYEVGIGTYSAANTLTRTSIYRSSNANGVVNFTAARVLVSLCGSSDNVLMLDAANVARLPLVTADPGASGFADVLALYAVKRAGRMLPKVAGPSGWDSTLQVSLSSNHLGIWSPVGNGTTVPGIFGMAALTITGTGTTRNVAAGNMFARAKRIGVVSAATAGSLAGYRGGILQHTLGVPGAVPYGGFQLNIRFGCSDAATVAGARQFIGMANNASSAGTNVEPSTLTNGIGVGHGAADTNLKIFYGGSAAQAPIDLGANFPANTLSTDWYELTLYAPSNADNTVWYRVCRLNTGHVAQGQLTAATAGTQLPLNTTLMNLQAWRTNNATALAVGLDFGTIVIEKDN